MIILSGELMRFVIYVHNVQQYMHVQQGKLVNRMRRAKPNNFAILREYIDTTLRFVLFEVFNSFFKELIHFFAVDV